MCFPTHTYSTAYNNGNETLTISYTQNNNKYTSNEHAYKKHTIIKTKNVAMQSGMVPQTKGALIKNEYRYELIIDSIVLTIYCL